jgi:Carboxypeptidase regulatory-like domain
MRPLRGRWISASTDGRAGLRRLVFLALWALAAAAHGDDDLTALVAVVDSRGGDLAKREDSNTRYTSRIVGLIADDQELGSLDVIFDGERYFLPARELAALIGAQARAGLGELLFDTPAGSVRIPADLLHTLDGRLLVNETIVRDRLFTPIRFDPARYALVVALPWWQSSAGARGRRVTPTPDREPSPVALSGIRLDYQYTDTGDLDRQVMDYRFEGALADGGWRVNVEQEFDEDVTADEYFWMRTWESRQVLAGYQDVALHPLLPSTPFTGGQALFSNRPLDVQNGNGLTQSNFARSLARPEQDIRGTAQPGAIAELRVDGRVVARQRVRLDGTFEFLGIDLPARGHADIEVLVFDRGYGTLIDRMDYSRSSSQLLLADGHQVFLLGGGNAGNSLDDNDEDVHQGGTAALAQWRRGLTDRITAEAALLDDGGTAYQQVGIVTALGARWVSALGAATDGGGGAFQGELSGFGARWRFDYYGQERGDGFRDGGGDRAHDLRYEYQYRSDLWLGLRGRYTDADSDDAYYDDGVSGSESNEAFLLPGASWAPNPRLDLRAWPNSTGDYRIDARYRLTSNSLMSYSYEDQRQTAEFSHFRSSGVEYYARLDTESSSDARMEGGARFSLDSDNRSYFQAALIATDAGKTGYLFTAEKTMYPGFYASLEFRDEPGWAGELSDTIDDTRLVQLRVTADLSVAGRRIVPADTLVNYQTTGAFAGAVRVDGAAAPVNFDGVTLIVDGKAHTVPSRDGRFYVGNLRPGVYRVRLSEESLPIELTPGVDSYWVKVAHGAVTRVDFSADVRYGAAGRIEDRNGAPLIDVLLRVRNAEGQEVAQVHTDAFGLYRVDGLAPGRYRLDIEAPGITGATEFELSDGFRFGIDLEASAATTESAREPLAPTVP